MWFIGQKIVEIFRLLDDNLIPSTLTSEWLDLNTPVYRDGVYLNPVSDEAWVSFDVSGTIFHLNIDTGHESFPGVGCYTFLCRTSNAEGYSFDISFGPYAVQLALGTVGGLPVVNESGRVVTDATAVGGQVLGEKAGLNFNYLFHNGGEVASMTLTGASGIAVRVWQSATRTLSSYGTLVADVATAVWGAVARTLTAVTGLGLATEAKQDAAAASLARVLGLVQENTYFDNFVWSTGRCTSFRMRIYSVAASVGTASDVLATYTVTMSYAADGKPSSYKVVKL